jgi:hypothetical protein
MTAAAQKILEEFEALGEAERQDVIGMLLLLNRGYHDDDGDIRDEELTVAAAHAWAVLDGDV